MKRATSLLAAALLLAGCKSTGDNASQAKDFDTGANSGLSIAFDDQYAFCPAATHFSAVNAYWLTLADAYVYATKDKLSDVAAQIKTQWSSLQVDFIASPDSDNPLEPSTQALWIETDNVAILAFRGTPLDQIDAQDIVSDVKALPVPFEGGGSVHKGFKKALDSVWSQVNAKLSGLKGTNKALFVTGHSLGGALATLTAAKIVMIPDLQPLRGNLRGLYTIGSPKVGTSDFVKKFTAAYSTGAAFPIVRMRNHNDIVTRLPAAPYQHIGDVYYLTDDNRLYTADNNLGYDRYKMPSQIAATITDTFLVSQLANLTDHVPTTYFQKIGAEYLAHKAWMSAHHASACDDAAFYATAQVADQGVAPGINTLEDLKGLRNHQLEDLFAKGTADEIPSASMPGKEADGTGLPLIMAGNVTLNDLAYNFWEGKKFMTDIQTGKTTLVNKLAGNWIDDISAAVYRVDPDTSSYVDPGDGKGYILLDYGQSNRFAARTIRDEIRRIAPGLYLGRANIEQPAILWPILGRYQFVIWFALGFPAGT